MRIIEHARRVEKTGKFNPAKNVLNDPTRLKDTKELREQYVLIPNGKADNNVGLIFKNTFRKHANTKFLQRTLWEHRRRSYRMKIKEW